MATQVTVADVRRALRLRPGVTATNEDLQWALDVALSYLASRIPEAGVTSGTRTYLAVTPGDALRAAAFPGTSVAAVRAWPLATSNSITLVAGSDYVVTGDTVRLVAGGGWGSPRAGTLDSPAAWSRVEVDWLGSANLPAAVVEAVALTAAGLYTLNPTLVKGVRSERIGGYSYTLSDQDVKTAMPPRAVELLRPFTRRRNVLVS